MTDDLTPRELAASLLGGDRDADWLDAGTAIMAALHVGPEVGRIHALTGVPLTKLNLYSYRLHVAGIWTGTTKMFYPWLDDLLEDNGPLGAVGFILHAGVAVGEFIRNRADDTYRMFVVQPAPTGDPDADDWSKLEHRIWHGNPRCPHCQSEKVHYLRPHNRVSRKTRTGASSYRRVWKCGACRQQFSVMTGTIMHGSKLSPAVWLDALGNPSQRPADLHHRHGIDLHSAAKVLAKAASLP
jgi:hypothetical protein